MALALDFSWIFFGHHKLLGFEDQYDFKMSMIFSSQNSNIVHQIESLSLNTRHGLRFVHLPCLHPFAFRHLTKELWFCIPEHFSVYLTMLCSLYVIFNSFHQRITTSSIRFKKTKNTSFRFMKVVKATIKTCNGNVMRISNNKK